MAYLSRKKGSMKHLDLEDLRCHPWAMKKSDLLLYGLIAILALAVGVSLINHFNKKKLEPQVQEETAYSPGSYQAKAPSRTKAPDYKGIQVPNVVIREVAPGKGAVVTPGSHVKVAYSVWIYDPKRIANRGLEVAGVPKPMIDEFKLGDGKVVEGFEEGLIGMRKAGKRILVIPSEKAYGEEGVSGRVPPDSIIQVEVELLDLGAG